MFLYRLILTLILWPALSVRSRWDALTGRTLPTAMRERWLLDRPTAEPGPYIWLHAASNGELASVRSLVTAALDRDPGLRFILTCNTETGRSLVESWNDPRISARLAPHDLRHTVRRFLDIWKPRALVVVENELWPERLVTCASQNVPVLVIGARMSDKSYRFWSRLPGLAQQLLGSLRFLSAQDRQSETRFLELGLPPDRLGPIVNLKSTVAATHADEPLPFVRETTLLAASTHEGEEEQVLSAFLRARAQRPELRLILAPRHPRRRDEIEDAIRKTGLDFATRSRGEDPSAETPIYLADTMGEMDVWYRASGMTFVGGSLVDRGGHTPFEPAAHGSAILHGPHVANSAPAYAALSSAAAAVEVEDPETLAAAILELAQSDRQRELAGKARAALADLSDHAGLDTFFAALADATGLPLRAT